MGRYSRTSQSVSRMHKRLTGQVMPRTYTLKSVSTTSCRNIHGRSRRNIRNRIRNGNGLQNEPIINLQNYHGYGNELVLESDSQPRDGYEIQNGNEVQDDFESREELQDGYEFEDDYEIKNGNGSNEDNVDPEAYYSIEKILGRRIRNGETQYLVKWEGYDESWNNWEPVEDIQRCKKLIKEFNQRSAHHFHYTNDWIYDINLDNIDFEYDHSADEALDIAYARRLPDGGIMFVVLWDNPIHSFSCVNYDEAKTKYPEILINFYEKHLVFQA